MIFPLCVARMKRVACVEACDHTWSSLLFLCTSMNPIKCLFRDQPYGCLTVDRGYKSSLEYSEAREFVTVNDTTAQQLFAIVDTVN